MYFRRWTAALLAAVLSMTAFSSCKPGNEESSGGSSENSNSEAGISHAETYRIDVYSQLANYAGEQIGWFAKVIKDKFNIVLNIVPSGEGVFATRMESGDLGDLIVFGNDGDEYTAAIEAGMLLDWYEDDLIGRYGPDIERTMAAALEKNSRAFGEGEALYGFGHNVASSAEQAEAYIYHPDIRFDLYQQIGAPEIPTLEDFLPVLKQMVDAQPTGDSGLPAYAFSLFSDWDGDTVMAVKAMGAFYGYDEWGLTLYDTENQVCEPVLDPDGMYMRALRFFNQAYQMGILDPESATQTVDDVTQKYADGRVHYSIFSWQGPANYNTPTRLEEGKAMLTVAAQDQKNLAYGLNVFGNNRVWAIGAHAEYPERIMEFLNWLCTPEGVMTSNFGPQGLTWDYREDGKAYLTDFGWQTQQDKQATVPQADGMNQINNTTFSIDALNPETGERYNHNFWQSTLERPVDPATAAWREWAGALTPDEYLDEHNYRAVAIGTDFVKPPRDAALDIKYKQVSTAIKDGTWKAMYAKNDEEFEQLVNQMIDSAKSYGYDECVAWDIAQGKARAEAENAVKAAQAE